jgi:hypothetical protein
LAVLEIGLRHYADGTHRLARNFYLVQIKLRGKRNGQHLGRMALSNHSGGGCPTGVGSADEQCFESSVGQLPRVVLVVEEEISVRWPNGAFLRGDTSIVIVKRFLIMWDVT